MSAQVSVNKCNFCRTLFFQQVILYVYQLKKKNRDTIAKLASETKEYSVKTEPTISKDVKGLPTCSCLIAGESSTCSDSDENNSKNDAVEAVNSEYKQKQRSLVMVDGETELEIETLLKASAYVLGSSIVYKAVLADGTAFAVQYLIFFFFWLFVH